MQRSPNWEFRVRMPLSDDFGDPYLIPHAEMSEQLLPQAQTQNSRSAASPAVEVRIENLYKSFGSHRVLDGINLEVYCGEMIALVGGSGSGKTTLLRHIIGLDQPDRGRVLIADHESEGSPLVDLATLNAAGMESLQRHWAVVFQGNALLSDLTVGDNIALPLREVQGLDEPTIRRKVCDVVREVVLDPDEVLDLTIHELSGGMAKRVGIARALALDPILLLYDEPTTGLDPQVAEKIQDLIGAVHHGKTGLGFARTTIVITHDKDMLYRLRPRIIMVDAGRILFDGTYEAFCHSNSPVIRPYFELMPGLHQGLDRSVDPPSTQQIPS
jgi:phospholipid/cholesterol/gamma-HCH transport system ATP-binding protein